MTYYVEGSSNERHHLGGEELGQLDRAYATRGNIYSYILPWESIMRNAAAVTTDAVFETWPHPPHVVAHMIRFLFKGTNDEHCMAHLKELRVRAHVLVGLGRIYAEHLHEAVAGARTATLFHNRAATVARFEANVRRYYPADRFGRAEGGLSDEVKAASMESAKRIRTKDVGTGYEGKNASIPKSEPRTACSNVFRNRDLKIQY